ncbi:sarcosine oxidase subunit alpha family protein [Roseitalea porphyridii]|uniref:Sarcosine oxidase subunit alpha family protein n=1 Tax=Roseitalea porphyridii TaxID=1852022 RepID=A0A4P6V2R7_9HYPH|nr:sarcosine oxidase subunit alpha family protein [Roseitalea porphyridii]QBK31767.1 sarcosine oxidase subunit alpha family protein [Roseitalea porphyridii]
MTAPSTTQPNRIAGAGRLTPANGVRFTFDGETYHGLAGDTLASALLANDVHLVGRSFKYHRPRGIVTAGPEEPNALVGIARGSARRQPNVRATVQEVHDGLEATSQNRWPSLSADVGEVNDWMSPVFAAGFYYKTFMWPKKAWDTVYEPFIRRAAGLGVAPDQPDPDRYAARYAHCDVLVCGGGAAGLGAALAAAEAGASVIICDERPTFGGALAFEADARIEERDGYEWAVETAAKLAAMDNVRVLPRTTAFGYYAQNFVALAERLTDHLAEPDPAMARERLWQVRAKRVVMATGAIERHMVFANNDRPGIMLASAARAYLNHYGVLIGRTIGVYTANDSAYAAAFELKRAGADIAVIADIRETVDPTLREQAGKLGIRVLTHHAVVAAGGKLRVSSIVIRPCQGGSRQVIPVGALIMSAGWTPSVHLFSQSRGKLRFDPEKRLFLPGEHAQASASAGACNGADDLAATLEEGIAAGEAAAKAARGGAKGSSVTIRAEAGGSWSGSMLGAGPNPEAGKVVKAFVDYQNDVTEKDIRLAVREGFHSIEHVKRFTTNGMATDQGKLSNMHGLAIAAEALDRPIPEVGLTTFRAPYTPVTFGALVGHGRGVLFDPVRRTAMHDSHVALGAAFEDVGQWKRPWYYPRAGEDMAATVNRECVTVRQSVGLFDASTLGKIEVVGPDAAAFLHLMYTNPFMKLGVGRLRYGIKCREDGFIYDDGVVGRIAADRFHVTTTTGGAPRVLHHMEDYLQTEFPDMEVWLTSTSEQWAVMALQGPKAAEVLAPFVGGMDLSVEAFPFMSVREGTFAGVPTRLFRMSFAGEDGFEINVPADFGKAAWDMLHDKVDEAGGCPYGTETMHVLRAEKGYIIVGQDTDGTVTPHDAGLSWAVGKNKDDFVGIRGLARPDLVTDGRRQLVGLRSKDGRTVLEEGAQIVADAGQDPPMTMIGWVSSSYWSANCGEPIAMALIEGGFDRIGQTLHVPMADGVIEVEVRDTNFWNPDKEGGADG